MYKLIVGLLLLATPTFAVTVAWDANPPVENVVAYRVGDCLPGQTTCTTVGETALTQYTLDTPLSVNKCYRVLAINNYGLTSDWSQEVCIQQTKPSAVNRWRVILYIPK